MVSPFLSRECHQYMRGVRGMCSNTPMYVHRVSHCSCTQNTKVVWMADNWQCCQHSAMDIDNDFLNRANSWPICFPTSIGKVCRSEMRSSFLQELQETRNTVDLPTAYTPPGFQVDSIMSALLTSAFITLVKKALTEINHNTSWI